MVAAAKVSFRVPGDMDRDCNEASSSSLTLNVSDASVSLMS